MKKVQLKIIASKELKLTAVQARKLFRYNPRTGTLRWRVNKGRAYAGDIAGSLNLGGYMQVQFNGTLYKVHRVIFLMKTGRWPKEQIDHENRIRNDNRWKNLREATNQENSKNSSQRIDNTSGTTGVYWYARRQEWHAQIWVDGKHIHLGYFTDKQDAIETRKAAEIKYGYHDNHGTETATVLRFRPYTVPKLRILSRNGPKVQLVRLPIAA